MVTKIAYNVKDYVMDVMDINPYFKTPYRYEDLNKSLFKFPSVFIISLNTWQQQILIKLRCHEKLIYVQHYENLLSLGLISHKNIFLGKLLLKNVYFTEAFILRQRGQLKV